MKDLREKGTGPLELFNKLWRKIIRLHADLIYKMCFPEKIGVFVF